MNTRPALRIATFLCGATVLCAARNPARAEPPPDIGVRIDMAGKRRLHRDVFGVNGNLSYCDVSIDDPAFMTLFQKLGSPFIRFPGGAIGNTYDWRTGRAAAQKRGSKKHNARVPKINARLEKNGIPFDTRSFLAGIGPSCRFAIVLNVGAHDPSSTRAWMVHIRTLGREPARVEMGNELYFPVFQGLFPDPRYYVDACRAHAAAVREVFPSCKVGLVVSSLPYAREVYQEETALQHAKAIAREKAWDEAVDRADFHDAVIIHFYSRTGIRGDLKADHPDLDVEKAFKYALDHDDARFPETFAALKRRHPGREIWVTEYNIKPVIILNKDPETRAKFTLSSTYLGMLFTARLLMKLAATEEVTAANWHNITSFISTVNGRLGPQEAFPFFSLFRPVLAAGTETAPVALNGPAAGSVTALFVCTPKKAALFLLNQDKASCRLASVTVPGCEIRPVRRKTITPAHAGTEGDKARRSTVTQEEMDRVEGIVLPGRSLTRIQFQRR